MQVESGGAKRRRVGGLGLQERCLLGGVADLGQSPEQPGVGRGLVGLLTDRRREHGDAGPGLVVAGVVEQRLGTMRRPPGPPPRSAGHRRRPRPAASASPGRAPPGRPARPAAAAAAPARPSRRPRSAPGRRSRRQADGEPAPLLLLGALAWASTRASSACRSLSCTPRRCPVIAAATAPASRGRSCGSGARHRRASATSSGSAPLCSSRA